MNLENKKKLWKIIQKKGDELKGRLAPHLSHPKGRNSYAHVCQMVKQKFNNSYKEISDEEFENVKFFIQDIKN
ncbi:MAG: hypothetical protein CMM91_03260 [Rickettsiales bacterium]|nr:hypothetical protein [Rickettsiales bacterium]OUV54076.1 MAG: hypothetical protein CBC87_02005 [Rickettsiales bacterium TMED127]|tara:strand:+ start:12025 stop:12243 length:219 start_codon:yes stop_codon:yes gene_type:complete